MIKKVKNILFKLGLEYFMYDFIDVIKNIGTGLLTLFIIALIFGMIGFLFYLLISSYENHNMNLFYGEISIIVLIGSYFLGKNVLNS